MKTIEDLFQQPTKEYVLSFKINPNNKNEYNNMRIQIIEKELELGHKLVKDDIFHRYSLGEKLDQEQINGRKYELRCREEERDILNPLPF